MKQITILLLFTTLVACNKNAKQDISNTKVVWAENVQSIVPMERDTLWTKEEWDAVYKYDKEKIFKSITNAVLSGKLKAYADYPGTPYTVIEVSNLLAPDKKEVTSKDVVQLKFNEKIELDTVSYTLSNKVSYITFLSKKYNEDGELLGLKKLFDVKLNEDTEVQKERE